MLPGGDLSKWNGKNIDFAKMAEGWKFVYLRGMFGGYNSAAACRDPLYQTNLAGVQSVGLPSGAYCFGNYMTYPERQAQWFAECVDGDWGRMPPMLDFEWWWKPYPSPANCLLWIQRFMAECDKLSGKETIFYCNPGMIRYLMANQYKVIPDWLKARSLSVAHYTTADQPSIYGFDEWLFWQYSDKGAAAEFGVTESRSIDLQWFNGDGGRLLEFMGEKEPGPVIPEIPDEFNSLDELAMWNQYRIAALEADVSKIKKQVGL